MKHTYKPFPHNVTVKESPIHGLGLIATKTIPIGTNIGISHYFTSEFGILRSPIGSMINHDGGDPSAFVIREDNILSLFAARDIVENEEITIDYRTAPCCVDDSDGDLENIIFE